MRTIGILVLLLPSLLAAADPPPQVLIESHFIELNPSEIQDIAGIAWDGTNFLVSEPSVDSDPPMFHQVSPTGEILASTPQEMTFTDWGHLDLTWCGVWFWASQCIQIHAFAPPDFTYQTYFNGPIDPCRALATDGETWWVGGHDQPIYRGIWDGTPGGTPYWLAITPPIAGASGIALDRDRYCLWITDSVNNQVVKADPDGDLPLMGEIPLLHGLFRPRGCCMSKPDLIVYLTAAMVDETERGPCRIVFYEIDDTAAVGSSWSEVKGKY